MEIVKYENTLERWFSKHPKVLVALSGGVDSCLVAFMARKFNGSRNCICLIGVSPSLKKQDLDSAIKFCTDHDISYRKVFPNEIEDPRYASNPINRCFYCKSALYTEMGKVRDAHYPHFELLNGNNYSDRGDYRPGMKAAAEYHALSPLAECKIDKQIIRDIAQKYHLEVWDKPASPCMSSRFPYGEAITVDKLRMVEEAEQIVNNMGFSDVRVRISNKNASIEVPEKEIQTLKNNFNNLQQKFYEIGFGNVQIDQEGLVSGKLNRFIEDKD
ncbi:MAG TPA: ATP-dependent sacrificial sulfur transferase LarE [Bacteroidales bacterium]|jgi:uncharacterized protein|nr:ATP-dependent sacrificial sulfur transferase LarE [Bacteroidales bacterium]